MPQANTDRRAAPPLAAVCSICLFVSWGETAFAEAPPNEQKRNHQTQPVDHDQAAQPDKSLPLAVVADAGSRFRRRRSAQRHSQPAAEQHSASADEHELRVVREGTSAKDFHRLAVSHLPLDKLAAKEQQRVHGVLREVSLYRRLPTVAFEVEPEVYEFFTAHPDVAVSIWRAMKISKFQMWQTGPHEYEADSGDGSVGIIDVIHRGKNQNLLICEGSYKSPFLPKAIAAQALIHLQSGFYRGEDGKTYVSHTADVFIAFPSQTVETAAKLISPVSNAIADRNFQEVSLFVRMMSLMMAHQPGWVERLADRLEGVLEVRKSQLLKLAAHVYVSARKRELSRTKNVPPGEISLDEVMKPLREADPLTEQTIRSVEARSPMRTAE